MFVPETFRVSFHRGDTCWCRRDMNKWILHNRWPLILLEYIHLVQLSNTCDCITCTFEGACVLRWFNYLVSERHELFFNAQSNHFLKSSEMSQAVYWETTARKCLDDETDLWDKMQMISFRGVGKVKFDALVSFQNISFVFILKAN